jgi:hypothetical protein
MKHPGATIFVVFFGISLLDALWGGHWVRAIFWIGVGLAFLAMDRARRGRRTTPDDAAQRPTATS